MIDTLNINKNSQLGGMVTVQLKKDDKIVEEVKAHNFITPMISELQNFVQRNCIAYDLKNGYYSCEQVYIPSFFTNNYSDTYIYLTDSDANPDPNAIQNRYVVGNVVGYATKNLYSGSDAQRGTINAAESVPTENGIKLVFDWPTHAANGTIKSIQFVRVQPDALFCKYIRTLDFGRTITTYMNGKFYAYSYQEGYFGYITRTGLWVRLLAKPTAVTDVTSCCYDGTYWYVVYATTGKTNFWKIDNNGTIVTSATLPFVPYYIAKNGNYLAIVGGSGYIYQYDLNGVYLNKRIYINAVFFGLCAWSNYFVVFTSDSGYINSYWILPADTFDYYQKIGQKFRLQNFASTVITDENIIVGYYYSGGSSCFYYYLFGNVISRVILPQAITKTSANTLKVIYEFNYY